MGFPLTNKYYLQLVLLLLAFVLFLQGPSIAYEQTFYKSPIDLRHIGVSGGLALEYERKILSNFSIAAQLYGDSGLTRSLTNSNEERGYSLSGIGIAGRHYFEGSAFSGPFLGIGVNLKWFSVKNFVSDKFSSEGEGSFYLPFIEFGRIWTISGYVRFGIYLLGEYAIERYSSGIGKQEAGWHYSLGFKFGASIKDPEWLKSILRSD